MLDQAYGPAWVEQTAWHHAQAYDGGAPYWQDSDS